LSSVIKAAHVVMATPGGPEPAAEPVGAGGEAVRMPALLARLWLSVAPLQAAAARRARAMVEQARREAEAIVAAAAAERDAVLEQARAQGWEAGRAEGFAAGAAQVRAEAEARLAALDQLVAELTRARDEAAARYEEDIVELALAVAARLVRKESSLGSETVRQLLREVLPRLNGVREITISVHPDDLAVLQDDLHALAARAGRAQVRWEADPAVTRGGVFVQTDRGGVDATVETRVTRLVESLLEGIGHGG